MPHRRRTISAALVPGDDLYSLVSHEPGFNTGDFPVSHNNREHNAFLIASSIQSGWPKYLS